MKNSTLLNKAALPAENPTAIKSILLSCMVAGAVFSARAQDQRIASPDGKLVAEFSMDTPGVPYYRIHKDGKVILESSRLGLIRDDEDFSTHLKLIAASDIKPVIDDYVIWTAKRSHNSYRANVRVFQLKNQHGKPMDVLFQVSDHGVAYRYRFPDQSDSKQIIREERSSFHFLPDTKAWLQPMSEAKTGWGPNQSLLRGIPSAGDSCRHAVHIRCRVDFPGPVQDARYLAAGQ